MSDKNFALSIVWFILLFHTIIVLFPLAYSFNISMYETNVLLRTEEFVGFKLWGEFFTAKENHVPIINTLYFSGIVIILSMVFSLCIALVLNNEFPLRNFIRAVVILPWAISEVVTAGMWIILLDPGWGVFNGIAKSFGLDSSVIWLSADWAMLWVALAFTWHIAPLGAIFILASLQSIPKDLYKVAKIDGANAVQRFIVVTLPYIKYVLLIVLVLVTVEAFRQFDMVFSMTSGGPGTSTRLLSLQIFRYNFQFSQYGLASAASFILVFFAFMLASIYFFIISNKSK